MKIAEGQFWIWGGTHLGRVAHIYIHISCKCDTNRARRFTLDAHASIHTLCLYYSSRVDLYSHQILLSRHLYLCMMYKKLTSYELQYNYTPVPLWRGPIFHNITYGTAMTVAEHRSDFKLITDTPYLTLTGTRYGMSVVRTLGKTDCVITAQHCNNFTSHNTIYLSHCRLNKMAKSLLPVPSPCLKTALMLFALSSWG